MTLELRGLTTAEVEQKRSAGQGNDVDLQTSRTYRQIVRKNVFNTVNVILFCLGGSLIIMGRFSDALNSAGLIALNAAIGTFQEIRAKRKLDEIALLTRPKIQVLRDGGEVVLDPAQLVRDDLIVVQPGDQLVVDGSLIDGAVEMDESLLTGESDAINKVAGDPMMSGSFCLSGRGVFRAEKVGEESYAYQLTASARQFKSHKTPLQQDVDYVIRIYALLALFLGFFLFLGAVAQGIPFLRTVQIAAVVTGIIPVGTYLMTIVSYALGSVRLIEHGALIQEPNAIESLSNVDVLCTDKTGTLTANRIVYAELTALDGDDAGLKNLLADFASSASVTNATSNAIIDALGGRSLDAVDEVPFSSARKWSALAFDNPEHRGVYVLGALEMVEPYFTQPHDLQSQTQTWSDQGLRVLVFAHNPGVTTLHDGDEVVLPELAPLGLIAFMDELRPHVAETIAGFKKTGVQLKVISGDNPHTVAALAKQAGLGDDMRLVSGPELATMSDAEFRQAANEATVFGRITPDQKERLVDALRGAGHYVAMIGDGVNDVLSLKKANLGISMESGSAATRGVADIILMNDSFGAMVPALNEGKRIISGMQNIMRLFVARVTSVALIFLISYVVAIGTPFLPGNNAAYALLTVGVPTFALAYWARPRTMTESRLRSIFRMTVPAALLNMIFGILVFAAAYLLAMQGLVTVDVSTEQLRSMEELLGFTLTGVDAAKQVVAGYVARSAMTALLVFNGLFLIVLSDPPNAWLAFLSPKSDDIKPTFLAGGMLIVFALILGIPFFRGYFEFVLLPWGIYAGLAALSVVWLVLLRFLVRAKLFERFLDREIVQEN